MGSSHNSIAEQVLEEACDAMRLWRVEGVGLDDYLDFYLRKPELRKMVSGILFCTFRHRRRLEKLLESRVNKKTAPELKDLLLIVLSQAFFLDSIAGESAANIAVSFVRTRYGKLKANFVNAVLRGALAESLPVTGDAEEILPPEVYHIWKRRYSAAELNALAGCLLEKPQFSFRACGDFVPEGLTPLALDWMTLERFYECESGREIVHGDWLKEGNIYIQDPATALAVHLIDWETVPADARVLDVCAAPGGKTLMLAEHLKPGAKLIAADRSAKRQKLTRENMRTHRIEAEIVTGDLAELQFSVQSFDLILADVPCSNSGVFRRRPDAIWRFTSQALQEVCSLQWEILCRAVPLLREGGQLLYSTCSLEPEENTLMAERLCREFPFLELICHRQLLPSSHHDGAFAALLRKK